MIEKIDHIGIVVWDINKAIELYSKAFELQASPVESMDELNLMLSFLKVGDVMVELIQPTGDGMYQKFIEEKGEGIHHICFKVSDIDAALERIGQYVSLRDKEPRPGGGGSRIAFVQPESVFNTEIEFVER